MASGNRNQWSGGFRTSVRKTSVEGWSWFWRKGCRKEEAAAREMVLLAVPWDNVPQDTCKSSQMEKSESDRWEQSFHGQAGHFTPANVGNAATSQLVEAQAPGARVLKALNNMTVANLEAHPIVNGASRVGAKKRV